MPSGASSPERGASGLRLCHASRRAAGRRCGHCTDLAAKGRVFINDEPHRPEHAIEVVLPFLHVVLVNPPIVPLLFGATSARCAVVADPAAGHEP